MQKSYYLQLINLLNEKLFIYEKETSFYLEDYKRKYDKALTYSKKVSEKIDKDLSKYIDKNCIKANLALKDSISSIITSLNLEDMKAINYCEDREFDSVQEIQILITHYINLYNDTYECLNKILPEESEVTFKDNKDNFTYKFFDKTYKVNFDTPINLTYDLFLKDDVKEKLQELVNLYTTISYLQMYLESNSLELFKIKEIKEKLNEELMNIDKELLEESKEKCIKLQKSLFDDEFFENLTNSFKRLTNYSYLIKSEIPYTNAKPFGIIDFPITEEKRLKYVKEFIPKIYGKLKSDRLTFSFDFNLKDFNTISMDSTTDIHYKVDFIDLLISNILSIYPNKKVHIHFIDLNDTLKLSKFMTLKKLGVNVDIFRNENEIINKLQEIIDIRYAQEDSLMSLGYESYFSYNKDHEDNPFDIHLNVLVNFPLTNNASMNSKVVKLFNVNRFGIYNLIIFNSNKARTIMPPQNYLEFVRYLKNDTYFLKRIYEGYELYFSEENRGYLEPSEDLRIKDLLKEVED